MNWQAAAAWAGATLGIINLVISAISRRPVIFFIGRDVAGETEIRLRVCNIGKYPLLIRKIKIFPTELKATHVRHDKKLTGQIFDEISGLAPFQDFIRPERSLEIGLPGLVPSKWCIVFVRWSQQRIAVPWTVRVASRGTVTALHKTALLSSLFDEDS